MPPTPPARPRRWATWPPTSSVLRPTRSRRRGRQRLKTNATRPAAWSAGGNARNSPTRSASLCSTTSDCATSCAGLRSTADTARSSVAARAPVALLQAPGDLGGLAEPVSASVETRSFDDECLQCGRVDGVALVEIDRTNRLAVEARVEEPFRILQLGPFWKRQPHGVLEGLAHADDAVVGPDGHPLGAGGLLPLHLFDHAWVGSPDQNPQPAQPLASPAGELPDDGIDLLGRGRVAHAEALLRRLMTQRTEGLISLSFRCVQPSQQHGRRFPSNSSDRTRWMC